MDRCIEDCGNDTSSVKTEIDTATLEKTVVIFSAMADQARLNILFELAHRDEMCVSELASVLDEKVNTISVRLKKLYDADLVNKRRDAKHIYYSIKDAHVMTIINNALAHALH